MAKTILMQNGAADETGTAYPSYGGSAMFSFIGTFDSAVAAIQISQDGTNWNDLHDQSGAAIAVTSATQDVYAEMIKQEYSVRAVTTGGGGSTDITITKNQ